MQERYPEGPPPGVGIVGMPSTRDLGRQAKAARRRLADKNQTQAANTLIAFIRSTAHSDDSIDDIYREAREALDRYTYKVVDDLFFHEAKA